MSDKSYTTEDVLKAMLDIAYLVSCLFTDKVPDETRVSGMDTSLMFETAKRHMMAGALVCAFEKAGIKGEGFASAKYSAIRKNIVLDTERSAFLGKLEEKGIWYMPIKGIILKTLYPLEGMREMADNDILIDADRMDEVKSFLLSQGFKYEHDGDVHESFMKEPLCNFEIHKKLFSEAHDEKIYTYYTDFKRLLVKDNGNSFGYHLDTEDFYVYVTAHEYKHYSGGGTGLRSLMDIFAYVRRYGDAMRWDYITDQLEQMGIADFEKANRKLALKLFSGDVTSIDELSFDESEMLLYIASSGTYGSLKNRVNNKLSSYGGGLRGKVKYIWSRIVLPMPVVKSAFPVFAKYKILLPLLPFYRVFKAIQRHTGSIRHEMKYLIK